MSSLDKKLKLSHVFCIASGTMISSGIFILPGIAFTLSGPSLFLAYLLAGLIALIGVLSIIELATAMPKAGGDYFFIGRTFGPLAGTITGTLGWLALSLKTAFAIFGLSEIIFLLTGIPVDYLMIALCLFFVIINIIGVEGTVFIEVILVTCLLTIMTLFVIGGIPKINLSNFTPFTPQGLPSIPTTAAFVFVSFGGLLKVATLAEEVQNPQRNIQGGIFLSIIVVTLLYIGIIIVTTGVLPAQQFSGSLSPVAEAAALIAGRPGYIAISLAASLAFVTTALAGLLSASRYPLALSRDGLFPSFLGKTSKRSGNPVASIILTGILILLALQLDIKVLVKSASAVIMITYIMSNIAVIVLRESGLSHYKPLYWAPLYPWIQILSVIIYTILLLDMGEGALRTAGIFILGSVLVYFIYGKKRATYDFALLHLLKKVVDKQWQEEGLDQELLEIIHHRDMSDLVSDIFSNMQIKEIQGPIKSDDLFKLIASDAQSIGFDPQEIYVGLNQREASFSTAITDFTAIPHMITKGKEQPFGLFVYRSKEGVYFNEEKPKVHALFSCLGNEQARTVHLHALASLAKVISKENFKEKWINEQSISNLKQWMIDSLKKR